MNRSIAHVLRHRTLTELWIFGVMLSYVAVACVRAVQWWLQIGCSAWSLPALYIEAAGCWLGHRRACDRARGADGRDARPDLEGSTQSPAGSGQRRVLVAPTAARDASTGRATAPEPTSPSLTVVS